MTPPKKTNQTKEAKPTKGKASINLSHQKTDPVENQTEYRQRITNIICEEIANSELSLWDICDSKPDMPCSRTFARWIADDEELCQKYARAKEFQADYLAAQIRSIADECRIGVKTTKKASGTETTTGDMVERSRLQIDARKWLASKLAPKKYGDKIDHTIGNPDGTPLDLTVNFPSSSLNKTT